jgi:hypothetical protein
MANLAVTYWNKSQLDEAAALEVQVLETRKERLGADHPDTLTSMDNLAFTWEGQGRPSTFLQIQIRLRLESIVRCIRVGVDSIESSK